MSIIYDALQKTQKNLNQVGSHYRLSFQPLSHTTKILIGLLIVTLLITLLFFHYVQYLVPTPKKPALSAIAQKHAPMVPKNIKLNGVFLSDDNQVAQINNQFYHLGEMVEGMQVIDINLETVHLRNSDGIIELKAAT